MGDDRDPIIIAPIIFVDAGPLIRLAAAGLLDSLRGLNRRIVLVDRVEDEVTGDPSKPFAPEIAEWIDRMAPAIVHARTVEGYGIEALRTRERTPDEERLLKRRLRDSGERAIREFLEDWSPDDVTAAILVYEDRETPVLMAASKVPLTLMTTRRFVRQIASWGINVDATEALESIADRYDLKPAIYTEIEPVGVGTGK